MLSIDKILKDFVFSKRKITNKTDCTCYINNKPCHDIKESELNCYLCYCPNYPRDENPCKAEGNKGKYILNKTQKIWDCSDCTINHTKEFIESYLKPKE